MLFLRIYQHLLPRAEAWKTTITKRLRQLFLGLTEWPATFRTFVDLILLDLFPLTTRYLGEWERQWGLWPGTAEADRRDAVAGEWSAVGGQSALYLQERLDEAGFPARVFECWLTGPSPWIARDPRFYTSVPLRGTARCGDGVSRCGSGAAANAFLNNEVRYLVNKDLTGNAPPNIPASSDYWPFFVYIAGPSGPEEPFGVDANRRAELERLLLKYSPLRHWIVSSAVYLPPSFQTDLLVWLRGDDAEATLSSGDYTAIPNRGTQGGSFTAMSGGGAGPGPDVVTLAGKSAPDFGQGECLQGTTSTLQSMHEPATNCDLFLALFFRTSGTAVTILRDTVTGTQTGIYIERTSGNALTFAVFDGSTTQVFFSVAGLQALRLYRVRVKKRGLSYELFLDGASVATGSASALTTGASSLTARLGAYSPTVNAVPGSVPEVMLFGRGLTDAEVARVESYLARWSAVPPYADTSPFWMRGDDSGAVITSGNYVSIPNRGTLGGTVGSAVGTGPAATTIAAKNAPLTTTDGGLTFGTTSSFELLHAPGTTGTISCILRVDGTPGSSARVLATRSATAGRSGILVRHLTTGVLQIDVGNGTVESLTIAGAAIPTGLHVLQITKNGNSFAVFLDGAAYASGTASGLAAGPSQSAMLIGSASDDTGQFVGAIPEVIVDSRAHTSDQLARVRHYLRRWGEAA